MDNKKTGRSEEDDLKGFEDFIQGQSSDPSFLPKSQTSKKNELGFEHFTFLSNDTIRLTKIKNLLTNQLPFSAKFDQSEKIIRDQREEIEILKTRIFKICDENNAGIKRSLKEVFDSFFSSSKN